jgi:hypothetical protein
MNAGKGFYAITQLPRLTPGLNPDIFNISAKIDRFEKL